MVSVAFRALAAGLLLVAFSACAGAHAKPHAQVGRVGASVAWSPDGRNIAWAEDGRIWIATDDMSGAHAITAPIDALGQIAWVSNGTLLYWADFRLYTVVPGAHSRLISLYGGDSDFSLGRDRTRIAAGDPACSTGCYGPVVIRNLRGRVVGLISPRTQNMGPSLALDGRLVAFNRNLC